MSCSDMYNQCMYACEHMRIWLWTHCAMQRGLSGRWKSYDSLEWWLLILLLFSSEFFFAQPPCMHKLPCHLFDSPQSLFATSRITAKSTVHWCWLQSRTLCTPMNAAGGSLTPRHFQSQKLQTCVDPAIIDKAWWKMLEQSRYDLKNIASQRSHAAELHIAPHQIVMSSMTSSWAAQSHSHLKWKQPTSTIPIASGNTMIPIP